MFNAFDPNPKDQDDESLFLDDQEPATSVEAEMASFDAINAHFGTAPLDNWWENED
jgi:hypothetical protein